MQQCSAPAPPRPTPSSSALAAWWPWISSTATPYSRSSASFSRMSALRMLAPMPCFISISLRIVPKSVRSSELTRALCSVSSRSLMCRWRSLPAASRPPHVARGRAVRDRAAAARDARVAAACTARRARGRIRARRCAERVFVLVERADVGLATRQKLCTASAAPPRASRASARRGAGPSRPNAARQCLSCSSTIAERCARRRASRARASRERQPLRVQRLLQRRAHRLGPATQLAHRLQVLRHGRGPSLSSGKLTLLRTLKPATLHRNNSAAPLLLTSRGSPVARSTRQVDDRRRALGACSTC